MLQRQIGVAGSGGKFVHMIVHPTLLIVEYLNAWPPAPSTRRTPQLCSLRFSGADDFDVSISVK